MTHSHHLRFASYNVRKCIGLDRRRKPERIVDVLNSIGADVVALQEADRRLGVRPAALPRRLIEQETDFRVVAVGGHEASLGWHGNAMLVRKEITTSNVRSIELPGTEPRGAIAVEISAGIQVVATHLGLRRSDRQKQLKTIRSQLGVTTMSTVIMGDFNEWSNKRGLELLMEDFQVHSPGRSFHAARPVAALDRVALGRGLSMIDGGVVETRQSKIASDHLPIWVDIRAA